MIFSSDLSTFFAALEFELAEPPVESRLGFPPAVTVECGTETKVDMDGFVVDDFNEGAERRT